MMRMMRMMVEDVGLSLSSSYPILVHEKSGTS